MTVRHEHDAFLRAVCEDPGDDTPRLVYADWLDENGEGARAEFIRAQCRLAVIETELRKWTPETLPDDYADLHDEHAVLTEREWKLFAADWLPLLDGSLREWHFGKYPPSLRPDRPFCYLVRRGFVAEVTLAAADFMRHAGALFRAAPVVRVRFADRAPWRPGVRLLEGIDERGGLWWFDEDVPYGHERHVLSPNLPAGVFRRLKGVGSERSKARVYDTDDERVPWDDLSRAAVAFGRDLAGLPLSPAQTPVTETPCSSSDSL